MNESRPPELEGAIKLSQRTEPIVEGHAVEEMSRTVTVWKTDDGRYIREELLWDIDRAPETTFREISPDEADEECRASGNAP